MNDSEKISNPHTHGAVHDSSRTNTFQANLNSTDGEALSYGFFFKLTVSTAQKAQS